MADSSPKIFEVALRAYYGGPVIVRDSIPELHPESGQPQYLMIDDVLGEHGGQKTLMCHTNSAEKLLAMLRATR